MMQPHSRSAAGSCCGTQPQQTRTRPYPHPQVWQTKRSLRKLAFTTIDTAQLTDCQRAVSKRSCAAAHTDTQGMQGQAGRLKLRISSSKGVLLTVCRRQTCRLRSRLCCAIRVWSCPPHKHRQGLTTATLLQEPERQPTIQHRHVDTGTCVWVGWETASLPPGRHSTSRQGTGSNRNRHPRAAAAGGCSPLLIASPICFSAHRPCGGRGGGRQAACNLRAPASMAGQLHAQRAARPSPDCKLCASLGQQACCPVAAGVATARAQLLAGWPAAATWGACAAGAHAAATMSHQAAARSAADWRLQRLHSQQMTQHCLGSPGLNSSSASSCSLHSHSSSRHVLCQTVTNRAAVWLQCTPRVQFCNSSRAAAGWCRTPGLIPAALHSLWGVFPHCVQVVALAVPVMPADSALDPLRALPVQFL